MEFKEICLMLGFKPDEVLRGISQIPLEKRGETQYIPGNISMMDKKVKDVFDSLFKGIPQDGTLIQSGPQVVFMAVESQQKALTIMRAFKAASPTPQDLIFAMLTPTSLTWTLSQYLDHVQKEHEFMKTNHPAGDPDMKRIKE